MALLYSTCLGTNCVCFKMFLSPSLTPLKVPIFFIFSFLMTGAVFIHWDFSLTNCQGLLLVLSRLLQCMLSFWSPSPCLWLKPTEYVNLAVTCFSSPQFLQPSPVSNILSYLSLEFVPCNPFCAFLHPSYPGTLCPCTVAFVWSLCCLL